MRRCLPAMIAFVLILPTTCFALLMCGGKEPLAAKNFKDWPGLADVVNDPSRESHCWCNGSWWLSYRGDVAALNRVLSELAEIESQERPVILLPQTPPRVEPDGAKKKLTEPPDWSLHVVQGVVRGMHQHWDIESLDDVHPTLWVYISDRVPLSEIQIPHNIKLLQTADIRHRYEAGIASDNERARNYAQRKLGDFNSKIPQDGPAADEYQSRLTAIAEFVKRHDAAKSPE